METAGAAMLEYWLTYMFSSDSIPAGKRLTLGSRRISADR